jgi:multiple sugar transport system permease protein
MRQKLVPRPAVSGEAVRPGEQAGRLRARKPKWHLGFEQWALMPLLIFLLLFVVYPVAELIRMSFSTVTMSGGAFIWSFSGLANFTTMRSAAIFLIAVLNTILFVAVTVAVQIGLGTMLALMVVRARWLQRLARNVLLWPTIMTPVAISAIWWLILTPEMGLLNRVLSALGLPRQAWLASTTWALPALMLVDIWHWTPLVFLLILVGLTSIDPSVYEAARVDGASEWQGLRHVTLPLLKPTIVVAAMLRTILGFKVFDEIYVLTGGGPATSTQVISSYVQNVFFGQFQMGYGAFLGLVVTLVVVLAVALYLPVLARGGTRT